MGCVRHRLCAGAHGGDGALGPAFPAFNGPMSAKMADQGVRKSADMHSGPAPQDSHVPGIRRCVMRSYGADRTRSALGSKSESTERVENDSDRRCTSLWGRSFPGRSGACLGLLTRAGGTLEGFVTYRVAGGDERCFVPGPALRSGDGRISAAPGSSSGAYIRGVSSSNGEDRTKASIRS